MIYDHYLRLEPRQPNWDFERGFQAETGDPLWFLGRQWQMGEHQGEDAGSPVKVAAWVAQHPLDPVGGDPRWDPKVVPPEAIVESAPGDWWTMGRRIRYGVKFKPFVNVAALPDECFFQFPPVGSRAQGTDLPAPYDRFSGAAGERTHLDGWAVWQRRAEFGIPPNQFPEIPVPEPEDYWDYGSMWYNTGFISEGHSLALQHHTGGHMDWYSVDGDAPFAPRALLADVQPDLQAFPSQLVYPGAPNTRWWQIENAMIDIGAYPPDSGHFPSMLLTDLVSSHGTGWFLFPIPTTAGHVLTVEKVVVTDGFGDEYTSEQLTELQPPTDWSLFRVHQLGFSSLIVWPTVLTPLAGATLEQVVAGIDEYSDLLWAVERRVNSRDVRTPSFEERNARSAQPPAGPVNAPEDTYQYLPAIDAVPYWHPYKLNEDPVGHARRFVQARLADYSGAVAVPMQPEPQAQLLNDPHLVAPQPVHVIDPAAVPVNGLLLERRWMLARDVTGQPILWVQRQRLPLLAPPAKRLRFDVLQIVK